MNVTIGFSTTNKFMSRVIRGATGGKFWTPSTPSHAFIIHYDVSLGRRMVMQAETWGFEHRSWDLWQTQNILIAELEPIGPPLEDGVKWLSPWLGTGYDFIAAFLVGIKKFFKRAIQGRFSDPTKLMCAEADIRLLNYANYSATKDLDPETTSAFELLIALLKVPEEFRIRYLIPTAHKKCKVF